MIHQATVRAAVCGTLPAVTSPPVIYHVSDDSFMQEVTRGVQGPIALTGLEPRGRRVDKGAKQCKACSRSPGVASLLREATLYSIALMSLRPKNTETSE